MGHKPPKVLVELKNVMERGLFSPLPHPMETRFIKALKIFFPGRVFRLYGEEATLYRSLEEAGVLTDNTLLKGPLSQAFTDPAFSAESADLEAVDLEATDMEATDEAGRGRVSLWRPFIEMQNIPVLSDAPVLIPVLPWPQGPAVLVLDENMESVFPSGELIPPVLLAPAVRALYNLASELKAKPPNRATRRYPKIEKVLGLSKTGRQKSCLWRRRGIYLTMEPGINREKYKNMGKYKDLFLNFLEGGFLIPPSPALPIILPAFMSAGEESKLAELLRLKYPD